MAWEKVTKAVNHGIKRLYEPHAHINYKGCLLTFNKSALDVFNQHLASDAVLLLVDRETGCIAIKQSNSNSRDAYSARYQPSMQTRAIRCRAAIEELGLFGKPQSDRYSVRWDEAEQMLVLTPPTPDADPTPAD
jgi:hypothetical protein